MAGLSEVCGTVLFNEVFVWGDVVCVLEEDATALVVADGAKEESVSGVDLVLVLDVEVNSSELTGAPKKESVVEIDPL